MTLRTPEPAPDACPETAALADLVDGTLSDARRRRLEAHVAGCEACRTTVALVAEAAEAMEGPSAEVPASRVAPAPVLGRWPWLRLVAAAAVVMAVGAVFAMRRDPTDPLDAAFASLRSAHAGRFGDDRPLSAAELREGGATTSRGGIDWMTPGGTTTQDRPTFEWAEVAGAEAYRVTITDAEGVRVVSATAKGPTLDGSALPQPLRPGADYVWRVTTLGAPTPADGATALHVATASERAAVLELAATVGATVREELADLVTAQTLLRRGLAAEALPHARRYARRAPADPVGRATVALALRRLAPTGAR
ncbi:MAG: zf-HC2 domain-containing protein [Planctomycetota bacterium]